MAECSPSGCGLASQWEVIFEGFCIHSVFSLSLVGKDRCEVYQMSTVRS